MEFLYHNSNKNESTTGLAWFARLCLNAWVCFFVFLMYLKFHVHIYIISQATDEVPMMQQQSVQQQKAAPGVGFQPWVQRRTSHPSLSPSLLFALFQPLHWPPHVIFVLFACWSRDFCSVPPFFSFFFFLFDQPRIIFCRKCLEWLFMAHRSLFPPPLWLVLNTLWFSH